MRLLGTCRLTDVGSCAAAATHAIHGRVAFTTLAASSQQRRRLVAASQAIGVASTIRCQCMHLRIEKRVHVGAVPADGLHVHVARTYTHRRTIVSAVGK